MRVRTTFLSHNSTHFTGLALPVILVALLSLTACAANGNLKSSTTDATQLPGTATGNAGRSIKTATHTNIPPAASSDIQHYEYVFPDGGMYVYDIDHGHMLVKSITDLPTTTGVRGVAVSPATHMLYISYGGDGGPHDKGFLLKYDLITDQLVWTKTYTHGIDSMAISPDGKTIYMPDGELSADGIWYVIDANSGDETGSINGALGPHNTILSLNGAHVYLGGRNYNYLEVADTANNQVIKSIGPLLSSVRPFTINETETIAYMSTTGFLGFQVGDITTGKILYTVPIQGFSWDGSGPSDPSHGISLSPDEKELYDIDWANSYVHVFDVSHVPASAPRQVADIQLTRSMHHDENPCAYDCLADGWLQHSRDGRFVYVGDEGDVIDTATRKAVANLEPLYNTRKMLEIDWQNGVPIFTTSRTGLGYDTHPANIALVPIATAAMLTMYDAPFRFRRKIRSNAPISV